MEGLLTTVGTYAQGLTHGQGSNTDRPSYVAPDQLENSRCRPQHGKEIGTKHNLQVFIPGKIQVQVGIATVRQSAGVRRSGEPGRPGFLVAFRALSKLHVGLSQSPSRGDDRGISESSL